MPTWANVHGEHLQFNWGNQMSKLSSAQIRLSLVALGAINPREPMRSRVNQKTQKHVSRVNAILFRRSLTSH